MSRTALRFAFKVAVAAAMVMTGCGASRLQFDKSLHVVMVDRLHSEYSKLVQYLDDSTDSSGTWRLQVNQKAVELGARLTSAGFQRADRDDENEEKAAIRRTLGSGEDLGEFRAYRGEMALGSGTMCEALACNIAVLISDTSQHVYVSISKI